MEKGSLVLFCSFLFCFFFVLNKHDRLMGMYRPFGKRHMRFDVVLEIKVVARRVENRDRCHFGENEGGGA